MNVNDVIARNVRAARERKKLTLDGAAELTGVSRSMLAQIEKGEVNPGGRYRNYPAFPFDERRLFETYRIVIEPQGHLEAQPHMRGTEEYITVFQGTAEIGAGEEVHRLNAGDSIRFPADQPHRYANAGEEPVQLSMLIYYDPV